MKKATPNERVKFLKAHGATDAEAFTLVVNEMQSEIELLTLDLADAREMTHFIRDIVI